MKALAIPLTAYISLYTSDLVFNAFSPKIRTKQELEMIIDREAEKRGLDPDKISGRLLKHSGAYTLRSEDQGNIICVGGFGATERYVKHEISHIYFNDTPDSQEGLGIQLKYWLFTEPRAILNSF